LNGLSAAAQDRGVVDTANGDTAVAEQMYYYFTGKTPTVAGLAFLTNSNLNASDLNDLYYAKFSMENRYINFAANLGVAGAGATYFTGAFGTLTFAQAVEKAYGQIIGFNYAQAAGISATAAIADITGRLAYFQTVSRDGLSGFNQDLGAKAAMVGYIMSEGIKADVGAYATASNAFTLDMFDGTAQHNVDLVGVYAALRPTTSTGAIAASAPFDAF
jgi:serralysin